MPKAKLKCKSRETGKNITVYQHKNCQSLREIGKIVINPHSIKYITDR